MNAAWVMFRLCWVMVVLAAVFFCFVFIAASKPVPAPWKEDIWRKLLRPAHEPYPESVSYERHR